MLSNKLMQNSLGFKISLTHVAWTDPSSHYYELSLSLKGCDDVVLSNWHVIFDIVHRFIWLQKHNASETGSVSVRARRLAPYNKSDWVDFYFHLMKDTLTIIFETSSFYNKT
jgi:hypothetical protein